MQLRLAIGSDELRHDLPQLLHVQGAARAAAGRLQQDHGVAHGGHGQLGGADDVLGGMVNGFILYIYISLSIYSIWIIYG